MNARQTRKAERKTAVVVYDGECGVCSALRRFVEPRVLDPDLVFLPYQSPRMKRMAAAVELETAKRSVVLLDRRNRVFTGADAIARIMRRMPDPFNQLGTLLGTGPALSLAEPLYRWVVRNRTAISRLCRCRPDLP